MTEQDAGHLLPHLQPQQHQQQHQQSYTQQPPQRLLHPSDNNATRLNRHSHSPPPPHSADPPDSSPTTTTATPATAALPSARSSSPFLDTPMTNDSLPTTRSPRSPIQRPKDGPPVAGANTLGGRPGNHGVRSRKNRAGGGFLLSDALFDESTQGQGQGQPQEQDMRNTGHQRRRQNLGETTAVVSSLPQRNSLMPTSEKLHRSSSPANAAADRSRDPTSLRRDRSPAGFQPGQHISAAPAAVRSQETLGTQPTAAMTRMASAGMPHRASHDGTGIAREDFSHRHLRPATAVQAPATGASPLTLSPLARPNAGMEMDPALIVNMALSLSESRRMAARRNVSQPIPPRLAPLPDGTPQVGGSLRQHLQQQRRTSRTVSPKPGRPSLGQRISSPLHGAFDTGVGLGVGVGGPGDAGGSFRYHFSQSTLDRAKNAKAYLELLAQYRRVLDLVPPLKPEFSRTGTAGSPPSSPTSGREPPYFGGEIMVKLGREYNPLQFIRNRKVRARERKVINGIDQGFGNVAMVTDWVNQVASWTATGQNRIPGSTPLPQFEPSEDGMGVEGFGAQLISPPSMLSSSATPAGGGGGQASKSKRPRVDWVIHPADLLADVHWLEQDDNKKSVEDRNWHRVFPQDPELYRPLSRQTDGTGGGTGSVTGAATNASIMALAPESIKQVPFGDDAGASSASDHQPSSSISHGGDPGGRIHQPKGEPDLQQQQQQQPGVSTARERARQKLQEMRGMHQRNRSSVASPHDFLRAATGRRGSISESSDSSSSDGHGRNGGHRHRGYRSPRRHRSSSSRQARSGTISANGKDALSKHMMDLIAKERADGGGDAQPLKGALDSPESAHAVLATRAGAPATQKPKPAGGLMTPERLKPSASAAPSRTNSRTRPSRGSGGLGFDRTAAAAMAVGPGSPASPGTGRDSLEVPNIGRRLSIDYDSSVPGSPELRPVMTGVSGEGGPSSARIDTGGFVLPIGMDLSPPPSRAVSPSRNPFSRVKARLRDRSRVRGEERDRERERTNMRSRDAGELTADDSEAAPASGSLLDSPPPAVGRRRPPAASPAQRITAKTGSGVESHALRTTTTHGSVKLSSEESTSSSGLRGLLSRGPRIDTVLRSGVSKVSELIWRGGSSEPTDKQQQQQQQLEEAGEDEDDSEASDTSDQGLEDESDAAAAAAAEATRGRRRDPVVLPLASAVSRTGGTVKRGAKHLLDVMPPFHHFSNSGDVAVASGGGSAGGGKHRRQDSNSLLAPPHSSLLSRPPSRRSQRFDMLKPPRIDVQTASSPASANASPVRRPHRLRSRSRSRSVAAARGAGGGGAGTGADASETEGSAAALGLAFASTTTRRRKRSSAQQQQQQQNKNQLANGRKGSVVDPTGTAGSRVFSSAASAAAAVTSLPDRTHPLASGPPRHSLDRREVARLRAYILSSGILASEIARRAAEPRLLRPSPPPTIGTPSSASTTTTTSSSSKPLLGPMPMPPLQQRRLPPLTTQHRLAAQQATLAIRRSARQWSAQSDAFANRAAPQSLGRIDEVRARVAVDLSSLVRAAADEADDMGRDLVDGQRLKVKRVVDVIEKLLRRRRRRFRWVRRAGWLAVEWALVGFMWYVWAMVVVARVFLGVGRGVVAGVRWLLWL